jgi:hypothetical protein
MTETAMPNDSFDWDTARAQLGKRADEGFPPAWQPEQPDEEILGVVARVTMQAPTAYGPSPVVELVLESGERLSVWLYHTVLRRSFERERVSLGELVLIRYLGKRKPDGGGNAYDDYRLVVHRPQQSGEPDWVGMANRYNDELEDGAPRPRHEDDLPPADDDIPF